MGRRRLPTQEMISSKYVHAVVDHHSAVTLEQVAEHLPKHIPFGLTPTPRVGLLSSSHDGQRPELDRAQVLVFSKVTDATVHVI